MRAGHAADDPDDHRTGEEGDGDPAEAGRRHAADRTGAHRQQGHHADNDESRDDPGGEGTLNADPPREPPTMARLLLKEVVGRLPPIPAAPSQRREGDLVASADGDVDHLRLVRGQVVGGAFAADEFRADSPLGDLRLLKADISPRGQVEEGRAHETGTIGAVVAQQSGEPGTHPGRRGVRGGTCHVRASPYRSRQAQPAESGDDPQRE